MIANPQPATISNTLPERSFKSVVTTWFVVVFIGQMIFATYILMLYWKSTFQGNFERWNTVNSHFYTKGDLTGNLIFGLHVAFAAIITILGPIQLIPYVRKHAPTFHRISGRIYIVSAFLISVAGLYLNWVKGSVGGGIVGSVAVSMNAIIIMVCAYFTMKNAMQRKIAEHNQWAVHLFLGMSGVWMFRVFLMLWLAIHQAPVGFDPDTFSGPFLSFLSIFVYIFPQVVVAFYFRARASENIIVRTTFMSCLAVITIGMLIGIAAATMGMWVPRM